MFSKTNVKLNKVQLYIDIHMFSGGPYPEKYTIKVYQMNIQDVQNRHLRLFTM